MPIAFVRVRFLYLMHRDVGADEAIATDICQVEVSVGIGRDILPINQAGVHLKSTEHLAGLINGKQELEVAVFVVMGPDDARITAAGSET